MTEDCACFHAMLGRRRGDIDGCCMARADAEYRETRADPVRSLLSYLPSCEEHMIPGGSMPDPVGDDSFVPYVRDGSFRDALGELIAKQFWGLLRRLS
jgi:hypothetical protein